MKSLDAVLAGPIEKRQKFMSSLNNGDLVYLEDDEGHAELVIVLSPWDCESDSQKIFHVSGSFGTAMLSVDIVDNLLFLIKQNEFHFTLQNGNPCVEVKNTVIFRARKFHRIRQVGEALG